MIMAHGETNTKKKIQITLKASTYCTDIPSQTPILLSIRMLTLFYVPYGVHQKKKKTHSNQAAILAAC
jgi:hypothetical protein